DADPADHPQPPADGAQQAVRGDGRRRPGRGERPAGHGPDRARDRLRVAGGPDRPAGAGRRHPDRPRRAAGPARCLAPGRARSGGNALFLGTPGPAAPGGAGAPDGQPVVTARPRAVVLVADPAPPYSRGLRIARSLSGAGFDVEIVAIAAAGLPLVERDGEVIVRRYVGTGIWARWSIGREGVRRASFATSSGPPAPLPGLLRRLRRLPGLAIKSAAWPINARAWWSTLRRDLPAADLYHACGILAIPIALDLAAAARRQGRSARAIYDVIDIILESNNYARVPRPILASYRRREAAWVRRADAIVTVNDPIADHLARTWPVRGGPTVLLNCQPRWNPPRPSPDLIRTATGIPAERRVVLFLGRLGRERGLEEAARAVLSLDDAALVLVGFGPWAA